MVTAEEVGESQLVKVDGCDPGKVVSAVVVFLNAEMATYEPPVDSIASLADLVIDCTSKFNGAAEEPWKESFPCFR